MSVKELLLEIGTEEIPAGFMEPALKALSAKAAEELKKNRVTFGEVKVLGTPRRLVLHVTDVADKQEDVSEEKIGPSVSVGFDAQGNPTKAAEGFARSNGIDPSELMRIETPKGVYIGVRRSVVGRPTAELLAELLPEWIRKIPFKKSMRWGAEETAFARPVHWLLALLGSETINFSFAGTASSNTSRGHRFHAPDVFEVTSYDDYMAKLRKAYVIVDQNERRAMIDDQVRKVADSLGGAILEDEELTDTINYLVEYPVAVAGTFDDHFLELPRELLILTMRTHQKYYAVIDANGKLMNHFITVSNTKARDMRVVGRGNERVLRARLADAKFFFDEDQKISLEEHAEGLKEVVFQSKLGTSFEKVTRFSAVASKVAEKLCPEKLPTVERIAKLAKADLVTAMVYEFTELQGTVGRRYAERAGETVEVSLGIEEHYLPIQSGGELPSLVEATCVSIGDKIDTIVGCFGVGLIPSGTADPYALRRQTIGILRMILESGNRLTVGELVDLALGQLREKLTRPTEEVRAEVLDFFKGRLGVLLAQEGHPAEVVNAVVAAGFDDVIDARARVEAIGELRDKGEFINFASTFKRVANILKKSDGDTGDIDEALFGSDAESDLWRVYNEVGAAMRTAVDAGDYSAFFNEALKLKVVVDRFFDDVMVMDKDLKVRANRLGLLGNIAVLFGKVADFTQITT